MDADYLIGYGTNIRNDYPTELSLHYEIQRYAFIDTHGALFSGLAPMAACSKYEAFFDLAVVSNNIPGMVEFYFGSQGGGPRSKVGEVFVPNIIDDRPYDRHAATFIVPIHLLISTPQTSGDDTIFVQSVGLAYPFIYTFDQLFPLRVVYLGSSVNCGDLLPPPPFHVWCEPFPPIDAESADALIDAHAERLEELFDGTYSV